MQMSPGLRLLHLNIGIFCFTRERGSGGDGRGDGNITMDSTIITMDNDTITLDDQ